MARVLVAGRIHQAGIAVLSEAGDVELTIVDDPAPGAFLPHLGETQGLLLRTQPLTAQHIAAAPDLKIVSRHGVGYDQVDVDALSARGIPLAIVGDVNARTVAEHCLALMLAGAKGLMTHDRETRAGNWRVREAFGARELDGKTLLIVGMGRIGTRVATLAGAFGMKVLGYDPYLSAQIIRERGAEPVDALVPALGQADYVSLHLPKSNDTPVMGAGELAAMKTGAFLVNAARGGLVDEAALIAALKAGALSGAGLDVFEREPPGADDPLFSAPGIVVSPHIGGLTQECAIRMARMAARNILAGLAGDLDRDLVVNIEALGGPAARADAAGAGTGPGPSS